MPAAESLTTLRESYLPLFSFAANSESRLIQRHLRGKGWRHDACQQETLVGGNIASIGHACNDNNNNNNNNVNDLHEKSRSALTEEWINVASDLYRMQTRIRNWINSKESKLEKEDRQLRNK